MTNQNGEGSPIDSSEEVGALSNVVECVSPDVFPVDLRSGRDEGFHEFTASEVCAENAAAEDVMPVVDEAAEAHPVVPQAPGEGGDYHDEDGAVHFGDAGDARVLQLPAGVPVPSLEMVRRHRRAGHVPYRPWCACCVSGAANAPAHVARDAVAADGTPEVHCDYAFFRDKPKDVEHTVTVLVCKDRLSSCIAADVVPKKGAGGGYSIKQLERNIRKFGNHGKVVLRSDGEHAIRDLLAKVSAMRSSQTVLEVTPKGDSRANGRAERAVQQIEKQSRVLKLAVEAELGSFSVRHPCFSWLVLHAADVYNKLYVGPDGHTAYERVRGRPYTGTMFEFGQVILYKTSSKVQGGDMSARWAKGMWLGKRFTSEEHLIAMTGGLVAVSEAVRDHPEVVWDSQLFDGVVGVPWDPLAKGRGNEASEPRERVDDLPRVVIPAVRKMEFPKLGMLLLIALTSTDADLHMVAGHVMLYK